MRTIVILLVLAGTGYLLAGCNQSGSGDHIMGGGMMGGGMMGGAMMRQPPPGASPQALPEPQSEQARLFQRYCGQCHAPPAPAVHTAREWPQVVDRMKQHMVAQGKVVPENGQLQEIIHYLQQHAG